MKDFSYRVHRWVQLLFIRYSVQQNKVRVHYPFALQFIQFIGPFLWGFETDLKSCFCCVPQRDIHVYWRVSRLGWLPTCVIVKVFWLCTSFSLDSTLYCKHMYMNLNWATHTTCMACKFPQQSITELKSNSCALCLKCKLLIYSISYVCVQGGVCGWRWDVQWDPTRVGHQDPNGQRRGPESIRSWIGAMLSTHWYRPCR